MKEDYLEALNKLEQKDRIFTEEFLSFIQELGFSTSGLCAGQIENWVDLVKPGRTRMPVQQKN